MNRIPGILFAIALAIAPVLGGCSGDSTVPTENEQNNSAGLVKGDINPESSGFELITETSGDPADPVPGPFIIRGKNVHYVDSLQVLSVDFTVEHRCRCEFLEPIGLTFVNLLPPGVTVENPDNGVNGPGAAIVFEFENDDGVWSPFEESLPRTVHFGVDPGVSIGFVGRIDFDMDDRLGSIGGVVWNDTNENGAMDPDESGIGGVDVFMYRVDGPEVTPREILWRTVTDREGGYRFDGLEAGQYKVETPLRPGLRPTTPTSMDVILVEHDGRVDDFLMANFGCVPLDPVPSPISVGDYVRAAGVFSRSKDDATPYRFDATSIMVLRCGNPPPVAGPDDGPVGTDVFGRCGGPYGALCGPVTGKDAENRILEVMGTPVYFGVDFDSIPDDSTYYADAGAFDNPSATDYLSFDDVVPGDRVCVEALRVYTFADGPQLIGLRILKWTGTHEQIDGTVERVRVREDGSPAAIRVMDTVVYISESTVIRPVR